jgi:hypothetical protein
MSVQLQDSKVVVLNAPLITTTATAASVYGYLDCLGWDYAKIIFSPTIGTATGIAFKAIAITEGTNSTAATAIVALRGGSATAASVGFVVGNLSTYKSTVVYDLDLRKRERYLRTLVVPGEKACFSVIAVLTRGEQQPVTDAANINHIIL